MGKIELEWGSSFRKAFNKRIIPNKKLEERFWKKIGLFCENSFHPSLRTHKLSGELSELWAFSISYDCRVVFSFVESNKVMLIDIGSHEDVY